MASTPSTASDSEPVAGRYRFGFSWQSPYGHAVKLLTRQTTKPGVVLDLGCGFGAVAEVITQEGYDYVGTDVNAEALADLSARGLSTKALDLHDFAGLPEALVRITGGQRVAAILMLDVLEHLPETRRFLFALRAAVQALGGPALVLSVPNVAHADVSAKLAFGLWDRTPTGLLDDTHVQFFTSAALTAVTRECGFVEVDADDFTLELSDQHFPPAHPAIAATSPVAQLLRGWRAAADPHATTNQFVRIYLAQDVDAAAGAEVQAPARFLSVVMRTQGKRTANLLEALTCLAAQTQDNFDVLLMVHADEPHEVATVRELVSEFDSSFSHRVQVLPVTGGGRGRPLNVALDAARGHYVAFLDDDDLVTANWVQAFAEHAGDGVIVRSGNVIRRVSRPPAGIDVPYLIESGLECYFEETFDLARHFWSNQTPFCSFAVPRNLLDTFHLRFDESLAVLEDWEFLMRCATRAALRDSGEITSIYHRWTQGESSAGLHHSDLWTAVHKIVLHRLDSEPLVLPRGAASDLAGVWRTLDEVRLELHGAKLELIATRAQLAEAAGERDWLRQRYEVVIHSRRWRALARPARFAADLRAVLRRR